MSISKKIKASITHSSLIRKMFDEGMVLKKKFGAHKVYDFSLGNPNVDHPREFKKELIKVADQEIMLKHGYTPNAGYLETRQAVAQKLCKTSGLKITADHVVMSCGAGGALNVILKALLDPGDEVIILKPFFVEYPFYIENYQGVVKYADTRPNFSLDIEALDKAITRKTKAIIINSPNNPTGRVYSQKSITDLARFLKAKEKVFGKTIYLLSDEAYAEIVFDGLTMPSVLKAYPDSIVAYSYSKTLSLPGERIGYIAVNPRIFESDDLVNALILCTRIMGFVNAPALMQRIVANLQHVSVDVDLYQQKRDLLCRGLAAAGYKFVKPQGAFYLFVKSPISDDLKFVQMLLKHNILVVPGSGFGAPGYFRIAFCVEDKTIINSMDGFAATIKELKSQSS
ncbi:MAG: pyridoxal phosphate-dependent aminotransferase [Syntrophaceae bacterium]|jgi:aspartate aminotransferase|nr:pyridoxal phosphate-dependent aminotransferase [Syntrophaceae bacterium]